MTATSAASITRGRFITLEGIEGVGKSTQLAALTGWLQARGRQVVVTREPGGTPLGERLRAVLLDPDLPAMTPLTELLLMFAARGEHLADVIRPALRRGDWVVSDRFHDASYAYQGAGRGEGEAAVAVLDRLVVGETQPDLTLLLDAPASVGLARAAARRGAADRFEAERSEFFERARACYLARARAEPARFALIDATRAPEAVEAEIRAVISQRLAP